MLFSLSNKNLKIQKQKFKIWNPKAKIKNYKLILIIQNVKFKTQYYKINNPKLKIQNLTCRICTYADTH